MRVLPDVFAADYGPLAEGLLKTGMELVAIAGVERARHARSAIEKRRQHVVGAPGAGEDEVLIERRFEGTRVGNPKHSFGWLHVIGNADSRLGLVCTREAVVNILAQSEIEVPVTSLDLVFGVECKFLHIRMAKVAVIASTACEVMGRQDGEVIGILASSAARALRLIRVAGQGVTAQVHAGRVIGGIDDAQVVAFAEEGLSVLRADLDVMNSPDVREIRVDGGVGKGAVLGDGRSLKVGRAQVGERIAAGIVVVVVPTYEGAKVEDHVVADDPCVGWRDVEGSDFRVLVSVPDVAKEWVGAGAATNHVLHVQVVVGVRGLKPGAAVIKIQMNRVHRCETVIDAVENILLVALVVEDRELRRIEKAPGVEAVNLDKVAPFLTAIG